MVLAVAYLCDLDSLGHGMSPATVCPQASIVGHHLTLPIIEQYLFSLKNQELSNGAPGSCPVHVWNCREVKFGQRILGAHLGTLKLNLSEEGLNFYVFYSLGPHLVMYRLTTYSVLSE